MTRSNFAKKLPLSRRPTPSRPAERSAGPSVLVVEDEAIVAKDIEQTLVELGYTVTGTVRSAKAALRALEKQRPSIVLSDIVIKGDMDGVELAAIIAERFGTPVVFLSAHGDDATLLRATQTNPYGYVLKPFKAKELRAGLEIALKRHALDERLEQQSLTDELTGLHNRRGFLVLAEQQLKIATRTGRQAMLVYADLNGMKIVNDTLGHEAGDDLLVDAARALRSTFRTSDIVARLGGDEFAVLAVDPDVETQEILANRLQESVRRINSEEGRLSRLSMSVGVSPWNPAVHSTLLDLMAEADARMYRAKAYRRKHGSGSMPAVVAAASFLPPSTPRIRTSSSGLASALTDALFCSLESRDKELAAHGVRVARYCRIIAVQLGYGEREATQLARAAQLHDVGKMGLPLPSDENGGFTRQQIKALHTTQGALLVGATGDPELERMATVVLRHHERWDGTGFPGGLRGEECPRDARIVALADAYDHLTHEMGRSEWDALALLQKEAGHAFDPEVVDALLRARVDLNRARDSRA